MMNGQAMGTTLAVRNFVANSDRKNRRKKQPEAKNANPLPK